MADNITTLSCVKLADFVYAAKPALPVAGKVYLATIDKKKQMVLMSAEAFVKGGKNIHNVPLAITPDGMEPKEMIDTWGEV